MSARWQYKVMEIPFKMFGAGFTERMQAELDRLGPQGWELVSVVQTMAADSVRMVLKRVA